MIIPPLWSLTALFINWRTWTKILRKIHNLRERKKKKNQLRILLLKASLKTLGTTHLPSSSPVVRCFEMSPLSHRALAFGQRNKVKSVKFWRDHIGVKWKVKINMPYPGISASTKKRNEGWKQPVKSKWAFWVSNTHGCQLSWRQSVLQQQQLMFCCTRHTWHLG